MGFWDQFTEAGHELESGYDTVSNHLGQGLSSLAKGHGFDVFGINPADRPDAGSPDPTKTDDSKKKSDDPKKKDDDTKPAAPTEDSAYEQLANAQAEQYLQMTKNLDPLTSGSALTSVDSNMSQGAEAMLGTSSTSPISQWLKQQTDAAQAQYAPVAAANQGVAAAENQGQGLIASGLRQMGQAETAEMQAAPYSQLLQSLASEVPYKLFDNYNITNLTGPNVPQGLKLAETNLGLNAEGQTGGSTPTLPAPTTSTPSITPPVETSPTPQGG